MTDTFLDTQASSGSRPGALRRDVAAIVRELEFQLVHGRAGTRISLSRGDPHEHFEAAATARADGAVTRIRAQADAHEHALAAEQETLEIRIDEGRRHRSELEARAKEIDTDPETAPGVPCGCRKSVAVPLTVALGVTPVALAYWGALGAGVRALAIAVTVVAAVCSTVAGSVGGHTAGAKTRRGWILGTGLVLGAPALGGIWAVLAGASDGVAATIAGTCGQCGLLAAVVWWGERAYRRGREAARERRRLRDDLRTNHTTLEHDVEELRTVNADLEAVRSIRESAVAHAGHRRDAIVADHRRGQHAGEQAHAATNGRRSRLPTARGRAEAEAVRVRGKTGG